MATGVLLRRSSVADVLGDPTCDRPVAWAAAEAHRLLADLPHRWAHSRRVAARARCAAAGLPDRDRDRLVAAAYLHDIGYAAELVDTGFHPLDGARHLQRLGRHDLAGLIAHHTGADVEARHRGLAEELARFPGATGPLADALTFSDLTSGPLGERVDPGPRFAEVVDRHGPGSIVARSRAEARVELYAAVVRTLRRVSAARPPPGPLHVMTVELGCTCLVRLDGDLSSAGAVSVACAALDSAQVRGNHALVLDLASVGACSTAGVSALTAALPGDDVVITLLEPRLDIVERFRAAAPGARSPTVASDVADALLPHCDAI
ncbi:HD domain-containing protein [Aquipuribacter sp. MA13-6]|uniref:HD domain-containing protein n=1 Tax=unclassified Aquipuribacter TaxID=2635084 RepID=UPI003EEB95C1